MKGLIRDIAIALVIVLIITWFIKPTIVKESSMQPTLYQNNYLLLNKQAYRFGTEHRGDIIVFKSNLEGDNGTKKLLIKRIIGLPGDVLTIADGDVYVNGTKLNEPYTLEQNVTEGAIKDFKVPAAHLFVMGDNRQVSIDSRYPEVGCVPEKDVLGKAFLRLYPFNKIGGLY